MAHLNIVIPMAGKGQRFANAGYELPKPMIDVLGKPMIERVMDNLAPDSPHLFILIARKEHNIRIGDVVVQLDHETDGAICTVLEAKEYIDENPLLIANCDQLVDIDINELMDLGGDGALATFLSGKPHHSYVTTDFNNNILRIAEKSVISDKAVSGVYYFNDGNAFVNAAESVIRDNRRVLGEFYISAVISEMIARGYHLKTLSGACAILGTPEELQLFEMAAQVAQQL